MTGERHVPKRAAQLLSNSTGAPHDAEMRASARVVALERISHESVQKCTKTHAWWPHDLDCAWVEEILPASDQDGSGWLMVGSSGCPTVPWGTCIIVGCVSGILMMPSN